jgi:cytochrome c oxidase cbb3-type subunit I/II
MADCVVFDDSLVRWFMTATLVWGVVGLGVGLLVALQLVIPGLIPDREIYAIGRMKPLHSNVAMWAFLGNAFFAAVYFSTQRLCKTKLWSNSLGFLHFLAWQALIVAALCTLPFGITQARPFAEMEWGLDVCLLVVWVLLFAPNFFGTLWIRRDRYLYISLWFYIATIVVVPLLYAINNLSWPVGNRWNSPHSLPLLAGTRDAFVSAWAGRNGVEFFLTIPFLGMMYYFLPKATDRPIFSYKLSIIHFWSLILFFLLAGPKYLHYLPIPEWLSSLGMVVALVLWMPMVGGFINGWMTIKNANKQLAQDPVLKFFAAALVFYFLFALDAMLLGIKSVSAVVKYSDWEVAHLHIGAMGWSSFMTIGMLYWLGPRVYQRRLASPALANLSFWLAILAIVFSIVPLYVAGAQQSFEWQALDENGQLQFPSFLDTLQRVLPMYWGRAIGGCLFIFSLVICLLNLLATKLFRSVEMKPESITASKLRSECVDPIPTPSQLSAILEFGKQLDVWSQLVWHRRWERLPSRFLLGSLVAVILASTIQLAPMLFLSSTTPVIAQVQPYTPLEIVGKSIYLKEGCQACHSQTVRPLLADTKRFGDYSKAGEFAYDQPTQWGTRRVGPDLSREGGKQSNYWHYQHLLNPQTTSSGSNMPSYRHLVSESITSRLLDGMLDEFKGSVNDKDWNPKKFADDVERQSQLVASDLVQQGGPVSLDGGRRLVQDTKIVALIAYLQRLGSDIAKSAPSTNKN